MKNKTDVPSKTTKDLLLKLAKKLRQKGHEYYNVGQKDKTAIFWELESIMREIAKEE